MQFLTRIPQIIEQIIITKRTLLKPYLNNAQKNMLIVKNSNSNTNLTNLSNFKRIKNELTNISSNSAMELIQKIKNDYDTIRHCLNIVNLVGMSYCSSPR